ncbi:MAG TPA: hypothetical protein VLJ88_12635 [Propionibacteriaceae bacterium]|nr:hypothetical protein [Propionibacteriaceae bacterium]
MSAPSPLSPPARPLDTSALTQPIDESALTAFIADSKATGKPWQHITTGLPRPGIGDVVGQLIPVGIPLVALISFIYVGGSSLFEAVWRFTFEAPFPLNLVIVGVVALIGFGVVIGALQVVKVIRSLTIPRSWWEAAYRITPLRRGQRTALRPRRGGLLPRHHLRHRDRPDRDAPVDQHRGPPARDRQLSLHRAGGEPGELPGVPLGVRRHHP